MLRKVDRDFRLKNAIVEGSGVGSDVTFVGVHDRRTDYLEFRRKRLKLRNLYRGYFEVRWVWELETLIPRLGIHVSTIYISTGRIRVLSIGVRQRDFRVRLRRHGVGKEESGGQEQRRLF